MTILRRYIAPLVALALAAHLSARAEGRPAPCNDEDTIATITLRSAVQYKQGWAFFESDEQRDAVNRFVSLYRDQLSRSHITVSASASPEGGPRWLTPLAGERAQHFAEQLLAAGVPDDHIIIGVADVDWQQLRDSVSRHTAMPGQRTVLQQLAIDAPQPAALQRIAGGKAWRYMYRRFFPSMRYARAVMTAPRPDFRMPRCPVVFPSTMVQEQPLAPIPAPQEEKRKWYVGVHTNLIHDAIAVPNIGVEVYLGRRYSLYLDYSGAWWGNRMSATYDAGRHVWRYEGGNVTLRRYFGHEAETKPLTGWHAGVYCNVASYDFQWGDVGKQGRQPSVGGGLELGYQRPIARRWNLDFAVAAGYFGGKYKTCHFRNGRNVWVNTRQRNYVGPTRAEVALVWLLGRGNVNAAYHKKGSTEK